VDLREWLRGSRFRGSPALLADYLDIPHKTVEGWVYERKTPNLHTRLRLYFLTGLDQYAPDRTEEERKYEEVVGEELSRARRKAERLEEVVENLWEEAEFFLLSPAESREELEQRVGRQELRSLGRLFQMLANPDQFHAWTALRSIKRALRKD